MDADARCAMYAANAASLPAGRIGHVDDPAHAALAVLENGYITGTVVHVDGGARMD